MNIQNPCQESDLCNISNARYSEKGCPQIYKALYGNAMVVSFSGTPRWRPETNRNICFRVFLLMREFFAWGIHEDWSNIYIYSETRNGQMAKSPKICNVFNPHTSFSGLQLNAASRKSLEIHVSFLAKRRTLSNQRFAHIKVFRCCNTS